VDIGDPDYAENRLFDAETFWRRKRTLSGEYTFDYLTEDYLAFWAEVANKAQAAGFEMVTADLLDRSSADVSDALLISNMFPATSERLIHRGICPAILLCGESPVIAWDFYHRLPTISARYRFTHTFPGARERVRSPGGFDAMFGTSVKRDPLPQVVSWAEREFMTCITANKRLERLSPRGLLTAAWARVFSRAPRDSRPSLRRQIVCAIDPVLGEERLEHKRRAIVALSRTDSFHLYGRGWDRVGVGDSTKLIQAVGRCYRGEVDDRVAILQRYRFTYVVENSRFPGFITEKLFDAFRAGSIPVYDGTPDVTQYVPKEAYVLVSDFARWDTLVQYLQQMTDSEAAERRSSAAQFLRSRRFDIFDTQASAQRLVASLQRV